MGTRTADTLKEIETLRAGLRGKVDELERRLPPLVGQMGRKAIAAAIGGGAGATAIWRVSRRFRGGSKKKKKEATTTAPVVVNVFPKGGITVAALGVAAWAGVKIFEIMSKRSTAEKNAKPALVTELHRSSSG